MKIFKTTDHPTEQTFIAACESYKTYYERRQRADIQRPIQYDQQIVKYVSAALAAEKRGEDPEPIEFVEMTKEEWDKKEDSEKRQEQAEERRLNEELRRTTQRALDLKKAASDPEFKRQFIRVELYNAGFTPDEMIERIAEEREGGEKDIEFWNSRNEIIGNLETEIEAAGE